MHARAQALAWCPWFGKYLVSGDSAPDGSGTIRVWDMTNDGDSLARNPERPNKLELDASYMYAAAVERR